MMANNRMWIRHKISGKVFPLARKGLDEWSYPMELHWSEARDDLANELNDFFESHMIQDQENNGNNYEIVTEII